jgi:hypothetical protein
MGRRWYAAVGASARVVRSQQGMDDTVALAEIMVGTLAVLAVVTTAIILWLRSAPSRARRAALATFDGLARRFGVPVAPGAADVLPWLQIAGPYGTRVTVRAELVGGTDDLNPEPGAWLRIALVVLLWVVAGVFMILIALAGGLPSSVRTQPNATGGSISGGIRCTTIALALPAYLGALVLVRRTAGSGLFGGGPPPTGDPAFDAAFRVVQPLQGAAMILTAPVRAALLTFSAEHGKIAVRGGQLLWSRRTYATGGLDRVLDGMARLTAALRG